MIDSSSSRLSQTVGVPTPSSSALPSSSRTQRQRHLPRDLSLAGVAKDRSQSAGSNWEADFAQYSDAEQLQKASKHLELTWKVHKVTLPTNPTSCLIALGKRAASHSYCVWCRMRNLPLAAIAKAWGMSLVLGATQQVRTCAYTHLIYEADHLRLAEKY